MITSNPNPLFRRLFQLYLGLKRGRHFRKIHLAGTPPPAGPVLLIANHLSWWDGFWAEQVVVDHWKKEFHVMMLEQELEKHRFLRWLGAFSLGKGKKAILESLAYASSLLDSGNAVVLIFPQGKIESMHQRQIRFGSGVNRLLADNPGLSLMGMVFLVDFFSNPTPSLWIYSGPLDREKPEAAFQAFYDQSLAYHVDHAE